MSAIWTVGETLPNGATVVSDIFQTEAGTGTTTETMEDSDGNVSIVTTPGSGTAAANLATIESDLTARLTTLENFIAANPNGVALTNADVLIIAQSLAGLIRLALGALTSIGEV